MSTNYNSPTQPPGDIYHPRGPRCHPGFKSICATIHSGSIWLEIPENSWTSLTIMQEISVCMSVCGLHMLRTIQMIYFTERCAGVQGTTYRHKCSANRQDGRQETEGVRQKLFHTTCSKKGRQWKQNFQQLVVGSRSTWGGSLVEQVWHGSFKNRAVLEGCA